MNLQDNFKCSNIWASEGEEEDQEIENLFEKIMKENFPNLAKEINFPEFQEAQRVPKQLDLKRDTPRTSPLSHPRLKTKRKS